MFGIVQQEAVYLGASAKHLETFRDVDDMHDHHTLGKLSDTRWGSKCDALTTLKVKFYSVGLDKLGKTQTLLSAISNFQFIVAFIAA